MGFILLAHNSACVGFMQGALEEGNRQIVNQQRKAKLIESAGFNKREFDQLQDGYKNFETCTESQKKSDYYKLQLKGFDWELNEWSKTYFQDSSKISEEEQNLISYHVPIFNDCYEKYIGSVYVRSPLVAEFKLIVDIGWSNGLFNTSQLQRGLITWGEFNINEQKISKESDFRMNAWNYKLQQSSRDIKNTLELMEQQDYLQQQRIYREMEIINHEQKLQQLENENRRLEDEARHLDMCARYPGTYMGCP